MDALNHADQMRLANLINDNSDDAEMQKKLDQVVELTSSTRDQAAVALHDSHYDVEKAVDMILEGDHTNESQWKSAGKKKNKNLSQANKGINSGSNKGSNNASNKPQHHHQTSTTTNTSSGGGAGGVSSSNNNSSGVAGGGSTHHRDHHHYSTSSGSINNTQPQRASQTPNTAAESTNNDHLGPSLNKANLNPAPTSGIGGSVSSGSNNATSNNQMQQHHHIHQQQHQSSQHKKSTRIPDSAVEMPNNELHIPSLNVQFGEMDLRDGSNVGATDAKGTFQDVLESNRLNRHSTIPSQDNKTSRHSAQQQQQNLANKQQGRPRRPYNNNNSNNNINNSNDDRRFYNNMNSNRGGRQISGNQRPYNPRPGQMNNNNNSRGVRTILNRGLQPTSNQPSTTSSNSASSGFPNSIDTWTNSTAEQVAKPANVEQQAIGVGGTLRVGQWSDVAGNDEWSEEDWEAKVMETKVFTPSSKPTDVTVPGQKNQPLLTDKSVQPQINLASKLSESVRDDVVSSQQNLNAVAQQGHSQHSSQKPNLHMNDIFDASVAKVVLEQQNLAAMKPKTSIGMSQYNKESSDAKTVLDQQNLSSIKPKTTMSMNQYNKEASESLKSLVGISSAKGVPSVPPGALPLMSQPQYIMGNAYHQPAMIPYYQAPDVHYQVPPTAGRDQNFQSVYSQGDALKFNRGTDGDAPSITTTQAAPVASQTHNQAFVANALHAGYQLTYAMPGAFNMIPQNLYSAAPIFPHIPQPTNTGSANTVYQKNTPASYQHHTGYSGYDQLNQSLIQDYVKHQNYSGSNMQQQQQQQQHQQQQQQQQPTSKASNVTNELDVTTGNSYGMYASVSKGQPQPGKQATYTDSKSYQQQMSNNGPQQQFGFSHNAQQQPSSISGYPLLQAHNLDNSSLNSASSAQQQLQQHTSGQRGGSQVNPSKYYPSWN